MCKKRKNIRLLKFREQDGLCYYCERKMWERCQGSNKEKNPNLICTAEHLQARQDGGRDLADNIVAACKWCNSRRHMRPKPLDPVAYKNHVQQRLRQGKWAG